MDNKASKKLVVYYSNGGNTKFIADNIAGSVGADVVELKPKKDIPKGFLGMVIGGFQAKFRAKPALLSYDKDPENYDIIYIGTPIWAGTFAPALNTFFKNERLVNKRIAFFCCYSGNEGTSIEDVKEALYQNIFLGEIGFI